MRYIFILLLLSSCVTKKACETKFPAETRIKDSIVVRDSIVIKDSIRIQTKDSIVIVESASGTDSMPCNENSKTTIKRNGDVFTIKVKNGKVYFDYDLKGTTSRFQEVISEKDREIKNMSTGISKSAETKVVVSEVKYIPWWVKVLAWIGAISILYFAIKYAISRWI